DASRTMEQDGAGQSSAVESVGERLQRGLVADERAHFRRGNAFDLIGLAAFDAHTARPSRARSGKWSPMERQTASARTSSSVSAERTTQRPGLATAIARKLSRRRRWKAISS